MIEVNQYLIILLGFAVLMVGIAIGVSFKYESLKDQIRDLWNDNKFYLDMVRGYRNEVRKLRSTIEEISKYIDWEEAEKNGYSIPRK